MAYSDATFKDVTDEIEDLLGDLLGIEAVSSMLIAWIHQDDYAPITNYTYEMPTKTPFTVYPTGPMIDNGEFEKSCAEAFRIGKQSAYATGAWLRGTVQFLYEVDGQSLITTAKAQQSQLESMEREIVDEFDAVKVLLDNHWNGGSSDDFEIWFLETDRIVTALIDYAGCAQVAAGASGDVILHGQKVMLEEVQRARDDFDEALGLWREDNDVFPFPPGSAYQITDLLVAAKDNVIGYLDKIPGATAILNLAGGKSKTASHVTMWGNVAFDVLHDLEARDSDPKRPETGEKMIGELVATLKQIGTDSTEAMTTIGDDLKVLLDDLQGEKSLWLDRLPHPGNPGGTYA